MSSTPIRTLVVDDHMVVRKGIQALLAEIEDIELVGEANNGEEAIRKAAMLAPDVILMDLVMPGVDGIEAIRHISTSQPKARILVLTSFATDDRVFPAIRAGALGYLLKDSGLEDLARAIRKVHRGEPSLHPRIARKVLDQVSLRTPKRPAPEPLTARELEVLRLLAKGFGNREIAEQLVIEEVTVRTHVSHILSKLQLANRVQATLYALREGLTSIRNEG
jgi:NarL family two-component system response regulator LiaR